MSIAKMFAAAALVVFAAALLMAPNMFYSGKVSAAESKVTICHFPGHSGDFVTFNAESNPAGTPLCTAEHGNAITVAESACENGHHASNKEGLTCADGDKQAR